MTNNFEKAYDPYEEMKHFYSLDNPTEADQFRFVEAMEYLIRTAYDPVDIRAFSFNLAMYYRDIREFHLEKKYLELGEKYGEVFSKEHLGIIWYYGLCGEQDYERAYRYFKECGTRRAEYMLADMYHYGNYVDCSYDKCRDILEGLMDRLDGERRDPRFWISTLFPEVSLRLVQLNLEEEIDTIDDLDCLLDSREILSVRQQNRPFWGNLKTMRDILETTVMMVGNEYDFIDLYDLKTLEETNANITFIYDNEEYSIDIFLDEGEIVYQFGSRWFHGADDFLEKARVNQMRLTTVYHQIRDIKVRK